MKKYILAAFLTAVSFGLVTNTSFAETLTDTLDGAEASSCITLSYGMSVGSKDSRTNGQVSDLQQFLQDKGYLESDPTGYFGNLTKAAVQKFQTANGITPNGLVGPITRAAIKNVSCNGGASSPSSAVGTYKGYLNGELFITTPNLSKAEAITNCMTNKNNNPGSSVRCTLDGGEIYSYTANSKALPTCSITTDKPSYTLGEKIYVSYTSTNANYATWKPDISGKDNFVLAGDKLIPSGNATLLATILGNPFVTLQVVSEAGSNTCTKIIPVSYLSAAPAAALSQSIASAAAGTQFNVKLESANTSSCVVTYVGPDGVTNTLSNGPTNGSLAFSPVNVGTYKATAKCTGNGGTVTSSPITHTVTSASSVYNFVAGSQAECNSSIVSKLGSQVATCTIGGGCQNANPTLWGACVDPARTTFAQPTAKLTKSPDVLSAESGTRFYVTLTSANATSCKVTYTGPNGGDTLSDGPTNGSLPFSPATTGTYVATAVCTGAGGTVTSSPLTHTVTVSASPVISQLEDKSIPYGSTATLNWSVSPSIGVTCVAAGGNLASGTTIGTTGSWTTPPLYTTTQYGMKCTNNTNGLSAYKYATVTVAPVSAPSVTLSGDTTISYGSTATLIWSVSPSTGVTCMASGGSLASGTGMSTSGSWTTPNLYTTTQYGMKCTDSSSGLSTIKYVTVTVTPQVTTNTTTNTSAPDTCAALDASLYCTTDTCTTNTGVVRHGTKDCTVDACAALDATQYCTSQSCITNSGTVRYGTKYCPVSSMNGAIFAANSSMSSVLGASAQCVDLPYNMYRGYESYAVTRLQEFLKSRNFLGEATGFYGDQTVAAVKEYQAAKGLPVTGMVYDFTRSTIKSETCQ